MAWKHVHQRQTKHRSFKAMPTSMRQAKVKQGGIVKNVSMGKCDNAKFVKDAFDSFLKQ